MAKSRSPKLGCLHFNSCDLVSPLFQNQVHFSSILVVEVVDSDPDPVIYFQASWEGLGSIGLPLQPPVQPGVSSGAEVRWKGMVASVHLPSEGARALV